MESDTKFTEHKLSTLPPVDFSFKKIKNLTDPLEGSGPRDQRTGKRAIQHPDTLKYVSSSLWLGNNELRSTQNIDLFIRTVFHHPEFLRWLDLSYNKIEDISLDLLRLTQITTLYFHGNCIERLETVAKLRQMKNLRKLTLHGNAVETQPFYRLTVIFLMPKLKSLDFITISPGEVNAPPPPGATLLIEGNAE